MREQMQSQRELFEEVTRNFHLLACVKEKHFEELKAIDAILNANPRITALVTADLNRHVKSKSGTNAKLTGEMVLRLAVLKQLKNLPYRELEATVDQTPALRQFTRCYGDVPVFTTIERAIKQIRPETWTAINEVLVEYAIEKKVETGRTLRTDTTVIETDIAHPVDARLLADTVRVLTRLMERAREACPLTAFRFANRTRRSKRRAYQIVMAKGKGAAERRERWYRDLLKVTAEVLAMARHCAEVLRPLAAEGHLEAMALLTEIDLYLGRGEQARSQCERRVVNGEKVPASEKIVSIFEEHTDIICRGKTQSPTEFGHKALFTTGRSGLITHYAVVRGNPGDDTLVAALLEDHKKRFGAAPEALTGDRRFHHAEAVARAAGVEKIALPKPGARNALRRALEKTRWFRRLLRFRAGIEGVLSTLLRAFGLTRCLWKSWPSFQSYIGLGVVAYNLRCLAHAL
jgi:IS5 family transposase